MARALRIIEDEHRSLGAVLGGLLSVLEGEERGGSKPDPALLEAMVGYIRDFPERLHHPKEDRHLFRVLRERAPELGAVLDALEEEHVRGAELIARLEATLRRTLAGEVPPAVLLGEARAYAEFEWSHMQKEEELVLPTAARALGDADWKGVDSAFESNADPLCGTDARLELRELFRRITSLAPAPIGVGPQGRKGRP